MISNSAENFCFPSMTSADLKVLKDSLLNTSGNVILHNRLRALFTLKSLKSEEAVQIISAGQ
jgi:deoxyhypusine monooxygenase